MYAGGFELSSDLNWERGRDSENAKNTTSDGRERVERENKVITRSTPSIAPESDRTIGFKLYALILAILAGTLFYATTQNWDYISALSQLLTPPKFHYTPIGLIGLPQAVIATCEIIIVGTVTARAIFPVEDDPSNTKLFLKLAALGFGYCIIGLIMTILSDIHYAFLSEAEILLAGYFAVLLTIQSARLGAVNREGRAQSLPHWLKSAFTSIWKPADTSEYRSFEILGFTVIAVIAFFIYYNAIMFPVLETDALIYHASAAAIVFYNHGMPLIDGVGVGLGMSSNYPLLFSYVGTFYYLIIGSVQDVYLRSLAPTMWLLSVLTTYLIGRKLSGNRKVGIVSAFLVAVVPSFVSYAFQTSDETTVTFFLALGFLFFMGGLMNDEKRYYFLGAGIFFGAACLTTYQALYFLVPPALIGVVKISQNFRNGIFLDKAKTTRNYGLLFLFTAIVGSAPYVRNALLLHDPVYPYLSNVFPAEQYSGTAMEILKEVSNSLVLPAGIPNQSLPNFLAHLIVYASLYPLSLIVVVPCLIMLAVFARPIVKEYWVIASFVLIPSILIVFSPAPFVRYFWLGLPYASIVVAGIAVAAYRQADKFIVDDRRHFQFLKTASKVAIPVVLAVMVVFPSFVLAGGQAYVFYPIPNYSIDNFLRYTSNPGSNASTWLYSQYGSDVNGWAWLDSHSSNFSRIATFETRVYYLNFALHSPSRLFYLDGYFASPLYQLHDLDSILGFMHKENISYVYVTSEDWNSSIFQELPMSALLGSPYFPLLFEDGGTGVFNVGPITGDPIIQNDNRSSMLLPAYTLNLSKPTLNAGRITESITAGSNAPRLFVENDQRLVSVSISYLDSGKGGLDINLFNPQTMHWLPYFEIYKTNSNKWRSVQLLVPTSLVNNYTEFGLHADESNFSVSSISVTTGDSGGSITGKSAFTLSNPIEISNSTVPKSLMIYLPILDRGDVVSVKTDTFGYNCSLEFFSGYIPLNESTDWWINRTAVARYPASATGLVDPSISWNATVEGTYTLVVANWDARVKTNVNILVTLAISASGSGVDLFTPIS